MSGGTAGGGTAGTVGSDAGAAGSTGAAGSAGTDANAGGASGGSAGSGGEAGGGDSGSGGSDAEVEPEPGDPYTHCNEQTDCNDGLLCAASQRNGQTVGYCASLCDASLASACPQPSTGTVMASCIPFASLCLLGTCDNAECPDGMRCIEISTSGSGGPFGGSGVMACEYPVRDNQG